MASSGSATKSQTASQTGQGPLPPGWDTKFDPRTGRYYFINHYTKSTSWEDPRLRYQQIGKASTAATSSSVLAKENKPIATSSVAKTTTDSSSASDLKQDSSAGAAAAATTSSSNETVPLQCYPIGTCAPPHQHMPHLTQLSDAEAAAMQQIFLQDLSNRKSAASPITVRTGISQASVGHVVPSGGAGTGVQASPLPLQRLQLEETFNGCSGSPMSQRSSFRRESHVLADISEADSTNCVASDAALANIAAMFPTVEESHIRDLLKKYHGSQAVVISALQVAKHPFITPGPSTVFTPPPTRHSTLPGVSQGVLAGIAMTGSLPHYYGGAQQTPTLPRGLESVCSSGYPTPRPGSSASGFDNSFSMGSPQIGQTGTLFRSFPRPHSSPKMKLRYLKSVFPTVEEYLLLDVLSNSDNNVQKAADKLVKMGYVKRDTPSAPRLHARRKEEERLAEKRTPLPKPPPIKSDKEKEDLRDALEKKMRDKYEQKFDIPERILYMALESVLYDEEQANSLITAMIEDDMKRKKAKESEKAKAKLKQKEKEKKKSPKPVRKALEEHRQPKHTSPKHEPKKTLHGKKGWSSRTNISVPDGVATATRATSTQVEDDSKSAFSKAKGPNPSLRRGPNDDLLLTDYVTWNGPDPDLRKGPNKSQIRGPNTNLKIDSTSSLAKGPNSALVRGPKGIAKGSLYSQLVDDDEQHAIRGK